MRKTLTAFLVALLGWLGPVSLALAQQFPATMPGNTVYGRLGGGTTGPGQAIPISRLLSAGGLSTVAPSHPVLHPSSGNIQGAGCITAEAHSLWWVDQNLCSTANVWQILSSDPSAVFTLTLSGTVTVGDAISLTITMGSGPCSGSGCTVTTGAATGLDTLQSLAVKLTCAIANNASLYNLNGSFCSGGVVANTIANGGYASGHPLGYVVVITNGVAWDFNSNIALKVVASVSGAATETVTIGNTNCGTRCSYTLDNNPAIQMVRRSGAAPQAGSTLAAIYSIGATSDCPTTECVNYGSITNWVGNSTSGALKSAWLLQTLGTNGAASGGTWFGLGAYSNYGGSPFASNTLADKGVGTFNAGTCYWIGATNAGGDGDSICQTSNQLLLTTSGDSIVLTSAAGVGFGQAPSGTGFYSAYGAFFAGSQVPSAGTGVGVNFASSAGNVFARNMGSGVYQTLNLSGSTIHFLPSASATTGVTVQANAMIPMADNATQLGSSINRWSSAHTLVMNVYGASSGVGGIVAQAAAGTPTLTLPNASGTFAVSATSPLALSATTGALTCTGCLTNTPAALTKTDDTNVTLTLGGTPTTALLQATSITAGWTGTLAPSRGGTGLSALGTGVATWLGTPSSANLATAVTDETGSGSLVFSASPTFTGTLNAATVATTNQLSVTYGSANFTLQDTGTSFAYFQIIGSGGGTAARMRVGSEGGAGNALFTGAAANAGVVGTIDSNPLQFFTANTLRGQFTAAGDLSVVNNILMGTATKTLTLKQGANGTVGTFVCTSGGTITINNTNIAITDAIIISLNTVGGTISTPPATKAITAATSFQTLCATSDTSTYNYAIIKNAA